MAAWVRLRGALSGGGGARSGGGPVPPGPAWRACACVCVHVCFCSVATRFSFSRLAPLCWGLAFRVCASSHVIVLRSCPPLLSVFVCVGLLFRVVVCFFWGSPCAAPPPLSLPSLRPHIGVDDKDGVRLRGCVAADVFGEVLPPHGFVCEVRSCMWCMSAFNLDAFVGVVDVRRWMEWWPCE